MSGTTKPGKLSSWNSAHMNGVRAAATFAVVAVHTLLLNFADHQTVHGLIPWLVQKGARIAGESVMVFYILSGFFIAGIVLRSQTFVWKRYLIDRFTRLYVVLLPALLLTACVDHLTRHTAGASTYLDHALIPFTNSPIAQHHTLAIFLGNLAFLQLVIVPSFGSNLPLWTLSSEFWYYIVFPCACLIVLAPGKLQKLLYAAGFMLWVIFFPREMVKYFLVWLLGALIYLSPSFTIGSTARRLFLTLTPTIIAMVLFLPQTQHFSKWMLDCTFSLAFALCLFLLLRTQAEQSSVWPAYEKACAAVASFSYSVYVTHFPVLLMLRSQRASAAWQLTPVHMMAAAGSVAGTLLLGWIFSQLTEKYTAPVRTWVLQRASAFRTNKATNQGSPEAEKTLGRVPQGAN